MSKTRVVITGMGIVSPVGNSVDTAWEAVRSGRSGIRNIDKYDVSAYTTQFAGLVADDFKADEWMAPKEVR
ncbi:MAG: beta-ketoacyl-ACP synthase II, partial [Proteobacteria bacterium]|nr:beta-ketoacyl-ACP synthase II [Pseudomonadota bacterium]